MTKRVSNGIAIIGLDGRFPGAANLDEYWSNLAAGRETISVFTDEELTASGIDVAAVRKTSGYVPARAILHNADWFDAVFFGMNAKQAEVTDPQQRLFLETAWTALENAGYDPERIAGPVGVYAGMGGPSYYLRSLQLRPDVIEMVGERAVNIGNSKDYLATLVAYKLNLRGPAVNINTACSTSLVAVCQACQSLLNYQCDVALAGGVSLTFPQRSGVRYQEAGIFSPDGHCRPFDAQAQGTVSGEGVGIVVLKRLAEALQDGDQIQAVIKGFGLNNDGSVKVSFTAPSVDGQAEAIAMAWEQADFDPETISYVEAHGTATPIGDPIEIAALTQVVRASTARTGFCALGSVKGNIGHADAAAGVAGLIKTVLALKHRLLPPSLNFTVPNPKIDLASSPFYVNTKLTEWPAQATPRRAGVSSFGLGGTNAHVVLEEAPPCPPASSSRPWQLLLLSAKTAPALEAASANLLAHLQANREASLADTAFTLQQGRQVFEHRQMLVCQNTAEALEALAARDSRRVFRHNGQRQNPPVIFMFPGQGAQHINMGAELYRTEAVFQQEIDRCSEILRPKLGVDLRQILYPTPEAAAEAEGSLRQTQFTQPALFTLEFALATLWMSWGVKPALMIGHSIGEYVAACLSGVFTLEDALELVAQRGKLMQSMPSGTMLAVPLPEAELQKMLPPALSLATVNGPSQCVVSGPTPDIDEFVAVLSKLGIAGTVLHTSHAFHSAMMEPILEPFAECVSRVQRNEPLIPFISNLTGTRISTQEAGDPHYWASHLRQAVRFGDGVKELLRDASAILLEVGPGTTLSSLARLQLDQPASQAIITSLRHAREQRSDVGCLLTALGQLWLHGVSVDWTAFYMREHRQRASLPTYPFQRESYWIQGKPSKAAKPSPPTSSHKNPDMADWFYLQSWKRSAPPRTTPAPAQQNWLVFLDEAGLGLSLTAILEQNLQKVIKIQPGSNFEMVSDSTFTVNPSLSEDYEKLVSELQKQRKLPQKIAHFWSITAEDCALSLDAESIQRCRCLGFDSLLFLAQAICKHGINDAIQINLISSNVQQVVGGEIICPGKAMVLGPCTVISQEHRNLVCRSLDVVPGKPESPERRRLVEQLATELLSQKTEPIIAYRGMYRWVQGFESIRLGPELEAKARLRERGVYLITGGFGNLGLLLAEHLAKNYRARLVLMGRSSLPGRPEWAGWLEKNGCDNPVSRRIRKVQELEAMGAEVLVLTANAADHDQVCSGVAAAYQRFHIIHGVFHAAGMVHQENYRFISELNRTNCELHFQPKVYGLLVLEEALKGRTPDFVVLLSSLSTVLGGLGLAAYAGANHFMDAFAVSRNRPDSTPWISLSWDAWTNGGASEPPTSRTTIDAFSITPDEGIRAFRRILGDTEIRHIIVSTGDLDDRLDTWTRPQPMEKAADSESEAHVPTHARPNVRTNYVPAQSEMERVVARIWEALLGIEGIGVDDNFFDLGGDSLLLMRLQVKIQQTSGINLSSAEMFQYSTISSLAQRLSQPLPPPTELESIQDRAQMQKAALARQSLGRLDSIQTGD
jgi:acyl transferase domain-containing protein